ncbi:MAG: ABC transporter permease [Desulfobacterales bacterium]
MSWWGGVSISVFGIVNTMLMAVLEQRREMPSKCVGAGKYDLIRLISLETTAIALAGSLAGRSSACFWSPVSGHLLRRFLVAYIPSGAVPRPDPVVALGAFAVCTLIGMACSCILPCVRKNSSHGGVEK